MRAHFCFSRCCSKYSESLVRPRPCSPGGYGRISIGHFGDSHLLPLRNSFIFSRRQRLQSAPVYLAMNSQTLRRLGGRHPLCGTGVTSWMVPTSRPTACRLRMAVSRPEPGPFTNTSTLRMPCSSARRAAAAAAPRAADAAGLRGHPRGGRRRLAGALEAHLAGARPGDHVAQRVGDRDDRVVERALDVRVPMSDVLLLLAAHLLRGRLLRCARHYFFPTFFLPATVLRGPLRVRALVWVR